MEQDDEGTWRRLIRINFDQQFTRGVNADESLEEKLYEEAEGILNLLVHSFREYRRNGLGIPDQVRMATQEYREEQAEFADETGFGQFLACYCDEGPDFTEEVMRLFRAFDKFRPGKLKQNAFSRLLTAKQFKPVVGGHKGKGATKRRGLQLNEAGEQLLEE